MKIIFDLRHVGLGNNGGSSTIIKSGNTLEKLGHDVIFIDSFKNYHTWTKLKVKHLISPYNSDIPSSDVIIATGYKSVDSVLKAPKRLGIKAHWIRGWETWQMPEDLIVKNILHVPTIKIVNSICLQRKLQSYGIKSEIIRPGYEVKELFPEKSSEKKVLVLGGLYAQRKHWKIKRTKWIFDTYKLLKKRYNNLQLWMFGNDSIPEERVDKYFKQPTMVQKNYFYNNIDIWLSPSMQEGLHMPPAEAMMTECPVIGTTADMSGTEDYLVNNYNGLVSEDNFPSFLVSVEKLLNNKQLRNDFGKNARKKIIELGNRETNMKILINYFMGIIK